MSDKPTDDSRHIDVPSLLSDQIRLVTNEGHYATLIAAMGRRIGEIQALLPPDKVNVSFCVLEAAIEAGRIQELNPTVTH